MNGQWDRFAKLLVRDLAIVAATLALWVPTTNNAGAGSWWPGLVGVLTALLTVLSGFLVHEWGHLLGAWVAGGAFVLPPGPASSVFLFRFDSSRNSREQFLSMSIGGFVASLVVVVVLLAFLPAGLLATKVALGLTALGVLATFVIEIPGCVKVWRGAPLPTGAAFVSGAEAGDRRAP